ncbi:hypothetical protein DL96DRAFT_1491540 [Flagelloscypha sp. PMI_526]|nr:hypothetical protein DL96DRAFT_1491540 [Flagelloscypha sp. PMI_526]
MPTLITLPSILPPTGLLLTYAIPLLFASLGLTFAGTFLTLDRTRSFPRAYDAIVPGSFTKPTRARAKDLYMLGGGVGGLLSGFTFGVHLTTFLTLLVPAMSKAAPTGPHSFLAAWLISSVVLAAFGGRWRYSAIALSSIQGGALFSLLLCMLIHPSVTSRVVITAIFMPLIVLLSLLPFPAVQYHVLRLANASAGAVGLAISIALLSGEPNWSNPWERYWVADGDLWGTSKEKGLSAAACILIALGFVVDFFLKRKFGENPDASWDSYLSKYSANLPDRAGKFTPAQSFMGRLMHGGGGKDEKKEMIFPDDDESDSKLKQGFIGLGAPPAYGMDDLERGGIPRGQPGFLKKSRSQAKYTAKKVGKGKKKREAIKFRPLGDAELSSSDDDSEPLSPATQRPWLKSKASNASSSRTLVEEGVDYDKDLEALRRKKQGFGEKEVPEYSDGEDVTEGLKTPRKTSGSTTDVESTTGWSPKFLQQRTSSSNSHSTQPHSSTGTTRSQGFKPVPATPSLIRAIDRVQAAHREAYRAAPDGLPKLEEEPETMSIRQEELPQQTEEEQPKPHGGWASFWRDVERKNKASRDAASPLPAGNGPNFPVPNTHDHS